MTAGPPETGALVVDLALGRPAVVMAYDEGKLYFRPSEGGVERTRLPHQLRPAEQPAPLGGSLDLPFDHGTAIEDLQRILAELNNRTAINLSDVHEAIALAAIGHAIIARLEQHEATEETAR